jgi:hypothetical protein
MEDPFIGEMTGAQDTPGKHGSQPRRQKQRDADQGRSKRIRQKPRGMIYRDTQDKQDENHGTKPESFMV